MAISLDNSVDGFISLLAVFAVGLVCRHFQRKAVLISLLVFLLNTFLTAGLQTVSFSTLSAGFIALFFSSVLCGEMVMIFAELAVEGIALHMWENAGSKFDEVTD